MLKKSANFAIENKNKVKTNLIKIYNKMKTYTTTEINREWKIKVKGIFNGKKINTLVGVSGLLRILGGNMEKLQKFVARAFKSLEDKCVCKVYGQPIAISFYRY